jgi:chemotaxis protein CheD
MAQVSGARDETDDCEPRRFRNPQDGNWHVQLLQGHTYVSTSADEVITTILGSCIAACIRDARTGIGGMNHFLLPDGGGDDRNAQRFGVNAMEMLINGITSRGGARHTMEAKLFGGANVVQRFTAIGSRNAEFAKRFLEDEGIPVIGGDVGGTAPRRIQYWPASGRARQLAVQIDNRDLVERELRESQRWIRQDDDVELF